jgi:solute carrier family 38 (sodium-coupled neutral amino acid transporter), member 11
MFWTWRTGIHSYYSWLIQIAVSLAQFCFAAGGMVSFCVIIGTSICSKIDNCVGDTIPHVLAAVFPGLRTSTLFSFLINRQVVIILCTALVSYPLSLYRDITKLAKASALALVSMVIIVYTVVSEGPNVPEEYRGTKVRLIPSGFGIFQAIGVISFGNIPQYYRR